MSDTFDVICEYVVYALMHVPRFDDDLSCVAREMRGNSPCERDISSY